MKECSKCGNEIEKYCEFPGQLCIDCFRVEADKIPLNELSKPDFTKALNNN